MAEKRPYSDRGGSESGPSSKRPALSSKAIVGKKFNFINFTQSATRSDGSAAERDDKYTDSCPSSSTEGRVIRDRRPAAPDIDLNRLVNPRELREKQAFLSKMHQALVRRMNSRESAGKSATDNISAAIQLCKKNPEYIYVEVRRIDKDDIQENLRRCLPSDRNEGYLCELRCQGVYISCGVAGSKPGARDRASENGMRFFDAREVYVVPMQREWRGKNHVQLVLNSTNRKRNDLPVFYAPPEGTEDHRREKQFVQRGQLLHQPKPKGKIGTHMGPPVASGKSIKEFVILENENHKSRDRGPCDVGDNPVVILNNSAQFSRMAIDYQFTELKSRTNACHSDFICTLYVEGKAIADAKGSKKGVKHKVSELALQRLRLVCPTVKSGQISLDRSKAISRDEIKFKAPSNDHLGSDNIGNKMLKGMGWSEGSGMGLRGEGISEPIKVANESFNREGLGVRTIDCDKISREEAEEIIREYASSDSIKDVTFSSELSFDERMDLRMMIKRYGLSEKVLKVGRKIHLVMSRKISASEVVKNLEDGGSFGRYKLMKPEARRNYDADQDKRFLKYQAEVRQCSGGGRVNDDRSGFAKDNRGTGNTPDFLGFRDRRVDINDKGLGGNECGFGNRERGFGNSSRGFSNNGRDIGDRNNDFRSNDMGLGGRRFGRNGAASSSVSGSRSNLESLMSISVPPPRR